MLYVVGLLAVGFSAVTGALAAEGRRMDLFGVLVLSLVTSLGGGTLRDLVLDVPVFWSQDDWFLWTGLVAGTLTFVAVRYWHPPHQFLLIADAIGLAFVAVLGTEKALAHQA
ncbi:MAG: TRIC cation channel family protein, partial [Planctomycetaceae bacterium]|nr:TRIC cation channel family protein [Planctomycetaceae bacterium]